MIAERNVWLPECLGAPQGFRSAELLFGHSRPQIGSTK